MAAPRKEKEHNICRLKNPAAVTVGSVFIIYNVVQNGLASIIGVVSKVHIPSWICPSKVEFIGDVDYNEDEYLNLGANYEKPQLENIDFAGKTEINIINLEDTTKDSQEDEEDNVKTERIENSILEARYVAQKINELVNSNYYVLDKKEGYRKVTYKDIVVLLRSTTELSPIYEKENFRSRYASI